MSLYIIDSVDNKLGNKHYILKISVEDEEMTAFLPPSAGEIGPPTSPSSEIAALCGAFTVCSLF